METKNINQDDYIYLRKNYDWFSKNFGPTVQKSADDFFLKGFQLILLGVSKNINALMEKESYFVTKVKIDEFHDMFFRLSEGTVSTILDKALGHVPKRFTFNKMSDLEAKVITAFNDYTFNKLSKVIGPPPPTVKRIHFDVIHLTFLLKDLEADIATKLIITIPEDLLRPKSIEQLGESFNYNDFSKNNINVIIKVGTTKFSVFDLKNMESGDIVLFEDSDTSKLTLKLNNGVEEIINIKPNPELILPISNEEASKMGAENKDVWDSLEVQLDAQFDTIKITLGELKNIEEGLVIDLAAIYNNKVTLKVEDKVIATGELVIVNDRYGVKVEEIIADKETQEDLEKNALPAQVNAETQPVQTTDESAQVQPQAAQDTENATPPTATPADGQDAAPKNGDEEFDYSDFELEDEDI